MNSLYDIVREGKVFSELSENNVKIDIIPLQSNAQWDKITSELETDVYFYSKYMLSLLGSFVRVLMKSHAFNHWERVARRSVQEVEVRRRESVWRI